MSGVFITKKVCEGLVPHGLILCDDLDVLMLHTFQYTVEVSQWQGNSNEIPTFNKIILLLCVYRTLPVWLSTNFRFKIARNLWRLFMLLYLICSGAPTSESSMKGDRFWTLSGYLASDICLAETFFLNWLPWSHYGSFLSKWGPTWSTFLYI